MSDPRTRDVNAALRATKAIELRAQKLTYAEIAAQCGYADRQSCHQAVQRELERTVVANVEEMRREECESLDLLESECWKRLYDTEYADAMLLAAARIVGIKERRAKLMGLDLKPDEQIGPQILIREIPTNYLEGPKEVTSGG